MHRDGQNAAYEYDPASDTWRILPLMKAGRGSVGVAALDGKIYAVGGRNPDGQVVATHEVFDPATNTWKELAPLPRARDHTATVAADGKIHVIGGRTGALDRQDRPARHLRSGDQHLDVRTAAADGAQRARRHALQGLILVLGGELPPNTFAQNEAYNPKTKSWRTLAPMPAGRHGTGAAVSGDNVYVAAGSLRPGSRRRHQRADRIYLAVTYELRRDAARVRAA